MLVRAIEIPNSEIWDAHIRAKMSLLEFIKKRSGVEMEHEEC